ncbi:MAG: efflux RND transporter periplasmic adaptor subunit, partial [Myxococcales bacterium]
MMARGWRHDGGMSKTRWLLVVVGVIVIGFIGVRLSGVGKKGGVGSAASASASAERVIPVTTFQALRQDVPIVLEGLGTVTPIASVMVRSQVDGRLDSVAFTEGQDVKKGDPIAQIDPRPFAIQLQTARAGLARDQATLDNARTTLARTQALVGENLLTRQELDNQAATVASARATLLTDQASISQAQLQLDYARIRSPIDGVTGVRLIDPGNLVRSSDATGIVIVTQLDPIAVLFSLPQDDLVRIQRQLAAGPVTTEAYARDGQTRLATGKLALVDNQVIAQTGTVRLKALFANPERLLWPNAIVKARLTLEVKKDALVVPAAAIQRGPNGTFLYIVAPDKTAALD